MNSSSGHCEEQRDEAIHEIWQCPHRVSGLPQSSRYTGFLRNDKRHFFETAWL